MKKLFIILFLLPIFVMEVYASPIPHQRLVKGKAVSIETDYEIGDVAVSDHEICDFMVPDSRREIYLNPREEGSVTLTVWDLEGKKRDVVPVDILASDVSDIENEAMELFSGTNVDVKTRGKQIILAGEAESKVVMEQAKSFASRYPLVENNVQMSGAVLETVAERIRAAIKTPGIEVRNVRGRLVLEGVAFSNTSARRAVEIAKLYEPNIIDLINVKETGRRPGQDNLVELNFYFVEIKKEALRSFGVRWSPGSAPKLKDSNGGGFLNGVANFGTTIVGFVFNFIPKLNLLRERGEARVLDKATLIVKSGDAGDMFNGTEVPYYSGENVTFKKVGIKIHAEPIAAGNDVDLIVDATFSSLAANIEAGIDTRSIATSAYVKAEEAVVLSNVVSNRDVTTYNRRPSDVDTSSALFNLALSKDFQSGRSEFAVFIKPRIIKEVSPAMDALKEYLALEDDMIKDRSKKEYKRFLNEKNGVQGEVRKGKGRRKVW